MNKITINEQGCPYSQLFDDIYFNPADGIAESEYVFLQNNHLEERCLKMSPAETFTIAETGFGTGLNFLLSAQLFSKMKNCFLHFISFEQFPLQTSDLEQIYQRLPTSFPPDLLEHFLSFYPRLLQGEDFCWQKCKLTVKWGDINETLPLFPSFPASKGVQAWFLDGFAPKKNSAMWSETVFKHMARLSASPCTLATFTSAGFVRRGLNAVGFCMNKKKGFGNKREMLVGEINS